ncbi:MAG: hypothetical protein J6L77_12750 [Coprococcus sp.]|nr:hypothetical protein [Coprococcus sp.]
MDHNFCVGCNPGSSLPFCAIGVSPSNAYIENIINNDTLSILENFVCHKTAQDLSTGKLFILSKCDDCGMCQIMCPHTNIDYTTFFNSKLEKVVFNDFGRASILFQKIFSDASVATEVQVKGNFRTKRIDLVIKKGTDIFLIKMLKTTDKVPFYMRSYDEVIGQYHTLYPDISFHSLCLVPNAKMNDTIRIGAEIVDLSTLNTLIGGL